VVPSHLADPELYNFRDIKVTGEATPDGDLSNRHRNVHYGLNHHPSSSARKPAQSGFFYLLV
jgi:hypothetical protein